MSPPDSRVRLYRDYVTTHTRATRRSRIGVRYFPVLDGLPVDRRSKILDIGCGAGELIAQVIERGYRDVAGIDFSEEQVELAHEKGRFEVRHGDLFSYLPDHEGTFDAITATDVLEHFGHDEVVALLDAIYTALEPGGVLVAQVPNATSPFFGNYAFGDFTHRSVFNARSVKQICSSAGFGSIQVFPVNPPSHGLISSCRLALWTLYAGWFKLALASETGQLRGHVVTQNLSFAATKPIS